MRTTLTIEVLDRSLEDMLQLAEIMSVVGKRLDRHPHDPAVKAPTLDVIYDLLSGGYVIAGDVKKNEEGLLCVYSWGLAPQEAVARISHEWAELNEPPNLGDVVWLEITDAGRKKIEDLKHLNDEERRLLETVFGKREPQLLNVIPRIGRPNLNWKERKAIRKVLLDELASTSSEGDLQYAHKIENLAQRSLAF